MKSRWYWPRLFDCPDMPIEVSVFVMRTCAPATAAPVGSVMVPLSVARASCPKEGRAATSDRASAAPAKFTYFIRDSPRKRYADVYTIVPHGDERSLSRGGDCAGAEKPVGRRHSDRLRAGSQRQDYRRRPQLPGPDRQRDRSRRDELPPQRGPST